MNWDQVKGNWKEFRGKVQERWGKITNDDLDVIDGRREQLAGRIQQIYGKTKEEAEREIDRFTSDCGCDKDKPVNTRVVTTAGAATKTAPNR